MFIDILQKYFFCFPLKLTVSKRTDELSTIFNDMLVSPSCAPSLLSSLHRGPSWDDILRAKARNPPELRESDCQPGKWEGQVCYRSSLHGEGGGQL